MNDLLVMLLAVAAAACAGYRASRPSRLAATTHLQQLERRLSDVEATLRSAAAAGSAPDRLLGDRDDHSHLDKRYAAIHYEALANQAAYERKLEDLEWRVATMGLERHAARTARCTNRQGATMGDRGHG
jgi:hypothetical protein